MERKDKDLERINSITETREPGNKRGEILSSAAGLEKKRIAEQLKDRGRVGVAGKETKVEDEAELKREVEEQRKREEETEIERTEEETRRERRGKERREEQQDRTCRYSYGLDSFVLQNPCLLLLIPPLIFLVSQMEISALQALPSVTGVLILDLHGKNILLYVWFHSRFQCCIAFCVVFLLFFSFLVRQAVIWMRLKSKSN